jgi:hypothetical protein
MPGWSFGAENAFVAGKSALGAPAGAGLHRTREMQPPAQPAEMEI